MSRAVLITIASAEVSGIIRRYLEQDIEQLRLHADLTEAEVQAYRELREEVYREQVDQVLERIEAELAGETPAKAPTALQ